jgi:hypothetical protein
LKGCEHKYLSLGSRSLCSNDRYGIVFILTTFLSRNLERNTNTRRSFELVRQEARIPVFFLNQLGAGGLSRKNFCIFLNQLEAGGLFSEDALDVFVDVAVLNGFAFVVFFFTTANSNFHFSIMLIVKKNAKWHNSKSFFFSLCLYLF